MIAKTLFEPPLVYIGELPIVIRRPDGMGQGIGQLQKPRLTELQGFFCAFEADGHYGATKLGGRLNLNLGPWLASATDKLTPNLK
jgi:hypothetical protein